MELIEEEAEQAAQAAEQDNEPQPEEQLPPEPPKPLVEAKEELAGALKKFKTRSGELESNEKRLVAAEKEERDLLEASMDEEEQVEKLSKTVARQRVLERKIEHACNGLESAEAELRYATMKRSDHSISSCPIYAASGRPRIWRYLRSSSRLNSGPGPKCMR